MPFVGDGMEPALRDGDLVAVVPADRWIGDGVYVFDWIGNPDPYLCHSDGCGGIVITKDNPHYRQHTLTLEQFNRAVIGRVVATCNILDPALLAS